MRVRKVRVRSESCELKQKLKDLDLSYTIILVFTTHHKLFSWLLRGLDKSDGPRMGWYDSNTVRGGLDFEVNFKVDIK